MGCVFFRSSERASLRALAGLLFVSPTSCPRRPRTELIVRVEASDVETLRPAPSVRIHVSSTRLRRDLYNNLDAGGNASGRVLAEIGFVPDDPTLEDSLNVVAEVARVEAGRESHVRQEAQVFVEQGQTLVLVMNMTFRCIGVRCPLGQTCVGDDRAPGYACAPIQRRASAYTPATPPTADFYDARPATDAVIDPDATDASEVGEAIDASDVSDASEVGELNDASDASDAQSAMDASDARDAVGAVDSGAEDAPDVTDATPAADACARLDGACVDLENDPENCGAVGAVCSDLFGCRMGRCEVPLVVQGISLHDAGGCVRMSDGTLRCWGANLCGPPFLSASRDATTPARVHGVRGATALTAMNGGLCWIVARTVHCCGSRGGVLLDGLTSADDVVAGDAHACALVGGVVRCAGSNAVGQCGIIDVAGAPTTVPLPTVRSVYAGHNNTCAITEATGEIYCWGQSGSGQIGADLDGGVCMSASRDSCPNPQRVVGVAPAVHMAIDGFAGTGAACGATDSQVYCWGSGVALGYGGSVRRIDLPSMAVDLGPVEIAEVARGFEHACVLERSGRVRCWGSRADGRLGDGRSDLTVLDQPDATAVRALESGVARLVARNDHTCALLGGADVRCWGNNDQGQLGSGTTTDQPTPVPLAWH